MRQPPLPHSKKTAKRGNKAVAAVAVQAVDAILRPVSNHLDEILRRVHLLLNSMRWLAGQFAARRLLSRVEVVIQGQTMVQNVL